MKLSLSNFSLLQALENALSKYILLLNRGNRINRLVVGRFRARIKAKGERIFR